MYAAIDTSPPEIEAEFVVAFTVYGEICVLQRVVITDPAIVVVVTIDIDVVMLSWDVTHKSARIGIFAFMFPFDMI